jgi:hypothetical protein
MDFVGAVGIFVILYVFGIIIWIFPYVLLAMILFFWSFIGRAKTMLKVFALSPVAMVALTIAMPSILFLSPGGFLGSARVFEEWMTISLFLAGIALVWGYFCVVIGYVFYKILQHIGWINDETAAKDLQLVQQPI